MCRLEPPLPAASNFLYTMPVDGRHSPGHQESRRQFTRAGVHIQRFGRFASTRPERDIFDFDTVTLVG